MSNYPFQYDDDTSIIRVDDNITELGGEAINQLRDAVFNIEESIGLNPQGSKANLSERLNVSILPDGYINASALTAVGLVTLPIHNNQVGSNAGIQESKLDLDFKTADLYTLIQSNTILANSLTATTTNIVNTLNSHIDGGPAPDLRHVASHIDLNNVPFDTRDVGFNWTGLLDKNGNLRAATQVASALLEINNDYVSHQLDTNAGAHFATGISVDATQFTEIPSTTENVQEALEFLDTLEGTKLISHRANLHDNGIPRYSRSEDLAKVTDGYDGYGTTVVPLTSVTTYLGAFPGTAPIDSVVNGDDIVRFNAPVDPTQNLIFQSQFSQVVPGDIIRINYGNGLAAQYSIDTVRFIPDTEYYVRLNGYNLCDTDGYAIARIDRPLFDTNTYGVLAVAASNALPKASFSGDGFLGSVIIGDPKAAMTLGNFFDPSQIDATHYLLYLQLYPNGNPLDKVINLPGIDVTGNAGLTPGAYTLDSIISATNNSLRTAGYNFRFIAFERDGNFGIMLSDSIDNASFSIVSGDISSGVVVVGSYINNVVGDAATVKYDGLGLGAKYAGIASPAYLAAPVNSTAALFPTLIIQPKINKNYIVNGLETDFLVTNSYDGYISSIVTSGSGTSITYTIENQDLKSVGLKPGKTITVIPVVDVTNPSYNSNDYGRFIIKDVAYIDSCLPDGYSTTFITVINGVHGTGVNNSPTSTINFPVRLYIGNDSVTFNLNNAIDSSPSGDYHRYHEIYVNDSRKTFSYERARLPLTNVSGIFTDTFDWHISSVSAKLKGWLDSGSTNFKKFIRAEVVSYNATTGEFEIRIGQRSGLTIINTGTTVVGQKNIPVRVYDNTGNDYLELLFKETSAIGTPTTIVPGFFDIEVFPTIATNKEAFLLASCEVNWQPSSNYNIVENVLDKREFGNVSEMDFTNSAIDFIRAVDKYTQINGVFRGFEYTGTTGTILSFNGGIGLVNGNVVNVNNSQITLPQIIENGTVVPQNYDWVICVNEDGEFEPVLITATKQQFFAKTPSIATPFYIVSDTYTGVYTERKDLLPIAIANVTIASLTVNSVLDTRLYLYNQTLGINAILNSEYGSLRTIDQIKGYCKQNVNAVVSVKDLFLINSGTTTINFTNLTLEGDGYSQATSGYGGLNINTGNLSFAGENLVFKNLFIRHGLFPFITWQVKNITFDNCVFEVNKNQVMFFDKQFNIENIKILNCTFNWNQGSIPGNTNAITDTSEALIALFGGLSNIEISGNTFICDDSSRRPFIRIYGGNNALSQNIIIQNNKFYDYGTSGVSQAAIVFSSFSTLQGGYLIANTVINNNICNREQGIYFVGLNGTLSNITVSNVKILNNQCGDIGWDTYIDLRERDFDGSFGTFSTRKSNSFIIESNSCNRIMTASPTGDVLSFESAPSVAFFSGKTIGLAPYIAGLSITNNNCNLIYVLGTASSSAPSFGNRPDGNYVNINNNIVLAKADSVASNIIESYRILCYISGLNINIKDNNVGSRFITGISNSFPCQYLHGVSIFNESNGYNKNFVSGNTIEGFAGTGILSGNIGGGSAVANVSDFVTNNTIIKSVDDIFNFIKLSNTDSSAKDNYLSGSYVDVGNTDFANAVISAYKLGNRNNITERFVNFNCGIYGPASESASFFIPIVQNQALNTNLYYAILEAPGRISLGALNNPSPQLGLTGFGWSVNLNEIAPTNSIIVYASVNFDYFDGGISNRKAQILCGANLDTDTGVSGQLVITASNPATSNQFLSIYISLNNDPSATTSAEVSIEDLKIRYRE